MVLDKYIHFEEFKMLLGLSTCKNVSEQFFAYLNDTTMQVLQLTKTWKKRALYY